MRKTPEAPAPGVFFGTFRLHLNEDRTAETAAIADTQTGKNRLYLEVSSREFSVSLLEDSAADLGTHNFQNVPEGHWH